MQRKRRVPVNLGRRSILGSFSGIFPGSAALATSPNVLRTTDGGPAPGVVDVKEFGAKGDGQADDSLAVQSAFAAAIRGRPVGPASIYFPPGEYLIKQQSAFRAPQESYAQNLRIFGAGRGQSTVRFQPKGDGEHWLCDASERNTQLLWLFFEHLRFIADDSTVSRGSVNLFRLNPRTPAPSQNWEFFRCLFDGPKKLPGTLMRIEGRVNGSENRFLLCRGRWWTNVLYLDNSQSVNHEFVSCDF
jgi:hypothetical protein